MAEMIVKVCRQCKQRYETDRPKTLLCEACRKENFSSDSRRKFERGAIPDSPQPVKTEMDGVTARRLDRRQFLFDAQLDARLYADCSTSPVRVIRPGDPEFEKVAREVTPIQRIVHHEYGLNLAQYHYLDNGGFKVV